MMKNPAQAGEWLKQHIKPEWKLAFWSAFVLGLLVHLPQLLADIPNHDGLASMHFDQNMITSGRWFLSIACGFSSYYTIPWIIGLLAMVFLGLTSVALTEFLELSHKYTIVLVSGLLVTFPALASTFAYVFTMDGYMLALLLAVLAVVVTAKHRLGFVAGGVCLAFSMGIYQAYLPFAILLCIYGILKLAMEPYGEGCLSLAQRFKTGVRYLYMGVLGVVLYYVILQILLRIQGKVLADYQGINGMASLDGAGLLHTVKKMYGDFVLFSLKGKVLWNNVCSAAALVLLVLLVLITLVQLWYQRKWWKSIWFYLIMVVLAAGLPIATNIILIISPQVTYHLLMRYQWVVYLILMVAFVDRYACGEQPIGKGVAEETWLRSISAWALLLSGVVIIGNYSVTDNIAYSNLQKRYEKTYAYCVRLLDRIEQTPGYYQGIPIAMVGVVGDLEYPLTDITTAVTGNMIGMNGDVLLYTGANYQAFMQHYLGATLNILPPDAIEDMYQSEVYYEMDSFPGESSIQIIDGIMFVKTENSNKALAEREAQQGLQQ